MKHTALAFLPAVVLTGVGCGNSPCHLKSTPANNPLGHDATDDIIAYHDRTKHHPERYANGPGGLHWANQPDPFRRFSGAPLFRLPWASLDETLPAAALFGAATVIPQPPTLERVSLCLE